MIIAPLLVLFGLLIHADLTRRCLPNRWILYYALLFPFYFFYQGTNWVQFITHCLVGVIAFTLLLLPFMRGGVGGGDVKLGAVVMLWAGPLYAAPALIVIGLVGALLGVAGWLADKGMNPQPAASPPRRGSIWQRMAYALSARRGVPYGVALVAGGMTVLVSGLS
nr:prepilin peptidase [Brenneria alni]